MSDQDLLIYASYGLIKSGSTFAFELTKRLFVQNGRAQPRLGDEAVTPGHRINFATKWDESHVAAMCAEAEALATTAVIKTHARPRPAIVDLLESGRAIGHAVYRDPRDVALSLLDAGEHARAKQRKSFADIRTLDDAMADIDAHLENFRAWAALPGIRVVDYATLTADTAEFARGLAAQCGLPFDHDAAVADVVANEFIQFNKGVQNRHLTEMAGEESDRFLAHYADLYDAFF